MALMKDQINILVVDDEESIVEFLKMGFEAEGYKVSTAFDGNQALAIAREINPHIIILDIMLPGMNGYEVCVELKRWTKASIIMLTARDMVDDRINGLNIGADDYMVKPFSFDELLARVNARLRNNLPGMFDILIVGNFRINDGAHEIFFEEKLLELSPKEYNLLKYLLLNHGFVLSKQLILEKVWSDNYTGDDNIIEVYIGYLRTKIGDRTHQIIRTVRGVGYKVII